MKKLKYFLFLLLYLLISTVFINDLQFFGIRPNINVIIVVIVGLLAGGNSGIYTGLLIGIFEDLTFSSVIGFTALVYMYIGYASTFISNKINPENKAFVVLTTGVASLIYNLSMFAYYFMHHEGVNIVSNLIGTYIPEAIYTMLFAILMLKLKDIASKYILF